MLKDASTTVPAVLRRAFPDSKILVAIPAFNEGTTIGSVVLKARQFASEVIVVDDGSSDDTAETAALAGAHVIQHARNLGKGLAIRSAWLYAREHAPGVFTTGLGIARTRGEWPLHRIATAVGGSGKESANRASEYRQPLRPRRIDHIGGKARKQCPCPSYRIGFRKATPVLFWDFWCGS